MEQSNQPYRLAIWTPLPPLKNGIAEYSVGLIEVLSTVYDVEVFVDKGYTPNALPNKRVHTFVYTEFEARHHSRPFDIIIYQVGTSPQHFYMFPAIRQYRGVVVLHDSFLGQAVYKYYYDQNKLSEFRRLIADELGQSALEQFNRLYLSKDSQRFIEFLATVPAIKWIVDASIGQIVHMNYVRDEIKMRYVNAHVYSIPMGVKAPREIVPDSPESLRQRFRLEPTTFVIGVLGRITATKSYNLIIEAVRDLVIEYPNILLVIVGTQGNFAHFDQLQTLIERYGLVDCVHVSGFVDEVSFTQLTMICDVIVNLRYPAQHQLSRTLMNAIAAGKPSIISNISEWAEFPDEICLRISHEAGEQDALLQLKSHLQRLISDSTLRNQMSNAAQQYFEQHLTMKKMLKNYNDVLSESFTLDKTKLSNIIPMANDNVQQSYSSVTHNLPREEVSSSDLQGKLRKLREINRETISTTRIVRQSKIIEFLVNSVRRIRNLGRVWQAQSELDELVVQREESLLSRIEYLESQLTLIQEQLEVLHNERYNKQ